MPITIPQLITGARCFQSCIPLGMEWPVANYLIYLYATGNPPPPIEDLANEAACFANCVPTGFQGAITIFLLNLISSNPPVPPGYPGGITTESGERITTESGDVLVP